NEKILTHPFQIQKAYQESMNTFLTRLKTECHFHNIDYNLITTNLTFDKALVSYLNKRRKV
ncbi:MAG TPA: DUF58 domain-containing protein, partial [Candidatus Kapabacteria bacterium]|nr:DUF58 domain-containing protein [Candidatus Kapabacteria bacterium]